MPYEQLEEIRSRKQEKVAVFLTAQHVGGMLCVTVPVYIATLEFPFMLRTLIMIMAAILGIALTLEIGGLPCYERLLWRLRGAIRVRLGNTALSPEAFTGVSAARLERALPAGGPIRVVDARTGVAQRRLRGHAQHDAAPSITASGDRPATVAAAPHPARAIDPDSQRVDWDANV